MEVERLPSEVLLLRLNRPHASNALNTRMGQELAGIFEDLAETPSSARCVLVTGAGDRSFCAGGDLKERGGMTDEEWLHQHRIFERAFRAILFCPVPIIAAVNGAAFGGGLRHGRGQGAGQPRAPARRRVRKKAEPIAAACIG